MPKTVENVQRESPAKLQKKKWNDDANELEREHQNDVATKLELTVANDVKRTGITKMMQIRDQ